MTTSPVMDWLADHLPLSLLCDLADPAGPDSHAILVSERPAADPIWLDAAKPRCARPHLKIVV